MNRMSLTSVALVLFLALSFHFVAAQEAKPPVRQIRQIDIDQFDKMRAQKDAVVLDVRTAQEFNQGHVPGALNLDIGDPQFRKKVGELDKSKTYLVHCARGVRSARAAKLMSTMSFANLFDYHGGFDEWKKSGKPVEKRQPAEH